MIRRMLYVSVAALALVGASTGVASAHESGGSYSGGSSYGGSSYYDRDGGGRASSYINPDIGAATANPDVNANSSCFNPDQSDTQKLSPAGTTTNNVHNDACFLGRDGQKLDGPASFQSFGVGSISACPDPDGAGPKVAILSDTNGDGRNDRCFQSGYQDKGTAGDDEFHARLNNTGPTGKQTVVWCSDSDRNGCADEWNKSTISINWVS